MKQLALELNLGVGDQLFCRLFLEKIKSSYSIIAITHSKSALHFWFNGNQQRQSFNHQLATLLFSQPPYRFVPNPSNIKYPFYPNSKIVQELNAVPTKPDLDFLCKGTVLDLDEYVVITTKMRNFPKSVFERIKPQLTIALKDLAKRYPIVILGEREVQPTKEYQTGDNRDQIFSNYNYLRSILDVEKSAKVIDLTLPALGWVVSSIEQWRQDCMTLKNAKSVINFGIGGNFWMSLAVAQKTICLRADNEWTTDLLTEHKYPGLQMTKNVGEFCEQLTTL